MVPYDASAHLGAVSEWSQAQGTGAVEAGHLPRCGFVVDGVAAGWLYRTDSGLGLIEHFITNPSAPLKARHAAVNQIGEAIIEEAKRLGISRLLTMTPHRSIGRMAIRHGFQYLGPMHVLTLEA